LTTTALVLTAARPWRAWAAAMPAVAAVDPVIKSTPMTARVIQDMARGLPARRTGNLINAHRLFC
jgi:hypothetical protein